MYIFQKLVIVLCYFYMTLNLGKNKVLLNVNADTNNANSVTTNDPLAETSKAVSIPSTPEHSDTKHSTIDISRATNPPTLSFTGITPVTMLENSTDMTLSNSTNGVQNNNSTTINVIEETTTISTETANTTVVTLNITISPNATTLPTPNATTSPTLNVTTFPPSNTTISSTTTMVPYTYTEKLIIDSKWTNSSELWEFSGTISKHNLTEMQATNKTQPVPDEKLSSPVVILLKGNQDWKLHRQFSPLANATFNITYFHNCSDNTTSFMGNCISVSGTTILFNLTGKTLEDTISNWTTAEYKIAPQNSTFKIEISPGNDVTEDCIWAINRIIIKETRLENETDPDVIMTSTEEPFAGTVEQMSLLATAMWDAFFVLLALFCACLIAFAIVICRNRRILRNSEPREMMVPRFKPRSSTFQLEQVNDNHGFRIDSV